MTDPADGPGTERSDDLAERVFGSRDGEAAPEAGSKPRTDPRPTRIRPAYRPPAATVPVVREAPSSEPELEPSDRIEAEADPEPEEGARIGIVGGRSAGKSYLFQSMVYRTQTGERSGALTYFLERDSIDLTSSAVGSGLYRHENLEDLLRAYESWERLEPTRIEVQRWYRLRLGYRCGVLGRRRASLDLRFLDGSGEGFFEAALTPENLAIWREGFVGVEVMVFCLPLWTAFPRGDLSDAEWEERDERLSGFQRVRGNVAEVLRENGSGRPVRTLLALTMADDGRSALETLRQRWIESYHRSAPEVLRTLRSSAGAARYLANARRVSEAVREEFRSSPEARIARIPTQLDLGAGEPWIVPLSAVDGDRLAAAEDDPSASQARMRLDPPVPVHVELPLLVALCAQANALM